jgi:hypothetical protein
MADEEPEEGVEDEEDEPAPKASKKRTKAKKPRRRGAEFVDDAAAEDEARISPGSCRSRAAA